MGGLEQINQRAYMHTRTARGHRRQRGESGGLLGGGLKGGKWGISIIVATIEQKFFKKNHVKNCEEFKNVCVA